MLKRKQADFSLLELTILLVMIGLLLGGILKGRELIDLTMTKKLEEDFNSLPVLIYAYQKKFKALPGDDLNVAIHVGGILATTPKGLQGNDVIDGSWNSATETDETFLFWQHIRLAGLAPGPAEITDPAYRPVNAAGGTIGVQGGKGNAAQSPINGGPGRTNPIRGTYVICSAGIPGKYVKKIDAALDDGNPASGFMMATPSNDYVIGAGATDKIIDAAYYTVCMGF
jgi:hypothetical protein